MSNAYINNLMECVPHTKELLDYNSDPEVIIGSCYCKGMRDLLTIIFPVLEYNCTLCNHIKSEITL